MENHMAKAKGVAERIEDAVAGMWKSATSPAAKKPKKKIEAPKKKAAKKATKKVAKKSKKTKRR
jgi:hypothetical protein